MSQNGDEGKQAQESRGGAGNGLIRPLALSFDAQMLPNMAKGRLHLPTLQLVRDSNLPQDNQTMRLQEFEALRHLLPRAILQVTSPYQ